MLLKILLKTVLFVFISSLTQGQIIEEEGSDSVIYTIETHILNGQFDMALELISKQRSNPYLDKLNQIALRQNVNYVNYTEFVRQIVKHDIVSYEVVSNFINEHVDEPSNLKNIDLDFVKLKWEQISNLRDEVSIDEATKVQHALDKYIAKFSWDTPAVRKALIMSSTHQIVLYIIQRDIDKGKELCIANFEEAQHLNDKKLMIVSLYYLCEFLIFEGKLDEYINTCEQALKIEETLLEKSSYYAGNLIHAIDAYIYKGGNNERVNDLLADLYNHSDSKAQSYSLYAKYLGILNLKSLEAKAIFEKFDVLNLVEYCETVEKIGVENLNPNDLYQLYREIANTLQIHGYLTEAIDFKDRTVVIIKKTYSQDLANSLANYKTSQAIKEKDIELQHQNDRKQFYLIIAFLSAGLLAITIFALLRKRKQSQILEVKNKQIEKALKEKELLVREVHHRVKNNFQIVSSLLELQSRDIEDEKALMLANEGKNRVKSMALIHQKLYQNEEGLIDFEEYTTLLVRELTALYLSDNSVETTVHAAHMRFDVDTAIPLGLIINELITNAYKYAFNKEKTGKLLIRIERCSIDEFCLELIDNGPGIPFDFAVHTTNSLGLRLVKRLVKQLHGTIVVNNNKGAHFRITFKDIDARRAID